MDIQVPLNRLMFGQDDGAGINARVSGRLEGIEALAANLYARGQIENLIIKRVDDERFAVSNGNRRLAAFHQIHGAHSDELINCTLREVDETGAFEDSLTTAVLAQQLHPVDQYEAFARLAERGKTNEEIARQYGLTEKQVRQALALGRLSPKIRDAWRAGHLGADAAKAFTLALNHTTQDMVYAKLEKANHLYESYVKSELGVAAGDDIGNLVAFVGAGRYRDAGGDITEDLFGTSHIVSNAALLKQLADEKLQTVCGDLLAEGWSWAVISSELPHGARWWARSEPKASLYEDTEEADLADLREKTIACDESGEDDAELRSAYEAIEQAVMRRSFSDRQRAKSGCIVSHEFGRLIILFGVLRPAEASTSKPSAAGRQVDDGTNAAPLPEPAISNALVQRLSVQATTAAATALIQDQDLALTVLLAGFASYSGTGIKLSASGLGCATLDLVGTKDLPGALAQVRSLDFAARMTLLAEVAAAALDFQNQPLDGDKSDGARAICDAIDAKSLNAALRGVFDARDYFSGVNKALCLRAIEEALGADHARQQGASSKSDIAAFAIENVPPTGWLPVQLRAAGYDGPPVRQVLPAEPEPESKAKPAKVRVAKATKPATVKAKAAKAKPVTGKARVAKGKVAKKPAAKKTATKKSKR